MKWCSIWAEVKFPSFSWGRGANRVFKDVFNKFYELEYLSEGKGIQREKKKEERTTWEIELMGSFKHSTKSLYVPFWIITQFISELWKIFLEHRRALGNKPGHVKVTRSWWSMITRGLLILLYLTPLPVGSTGGEEDKQRSPHCCLHAIWAHT